MQATSRPSWAYSTLIIIATIASFSHECCCCPCLVIKFVVLVRNSNPSRGSERRLRRLQTIVFQCRLSKNGRNIGGMWVGYPELGIFRHSTFQTKGPRQRQHWTLTCSQLPETVGVSPRGIPLEHHRAGREQGTASSAGLPQQLPVRGGHDGCDRSNCRSCRGSVPPLDTVVGVPAQACPDLQTYDNR